MLVYSCETLIHYPSAVRVQRLEVSGSMRWVSMDPTPDIADLIWFFEAEPEGLPGENWEALWPYAHVSFSTRRGEWDVLVTVDPGYERIQLTAARGDETAIDLDLRRVTTVDMERLHGAETLRVHFRPDDPPHTLRLRLKPSFALSWAMNELPWSSTA